MNLFNKYSHDALTAQCLDLLKSLTRRPKPFPNQRRPIQSKPTVYKLMEYIPILDELRFIQSPIPITLSQSKRQTLLTEV